jgi:hypothetical protein
LIRVRTVFGSIKRWEATYLIFQAVTPYLPSIHRIFLISKMLLLSFALSMSNVYSNMNRILFSFLFLIVFATQISAQKHGDCATALDVCKKQTYKFDHVSGIGKNEYEAEAVPCFLNSDKGGDAEMNSTWVKFEIKKGGSLSFTISPNDKNHDYDFVVYRLQSSGNCETKQIVRCSAAGEQNEYSPCMGNTGLRSGESDSSEDAGCRDEGDNAWLAPLRTASGEKYVILISNVTESGAGFALSFGGSAMLMCDEKEKPEVAAKPEPKKQNPPVLKPEPKAETVIVKPTETPRAPNNAPQNLGDRQVDVKEDVIRVASQKIRVSIWDDGLEDGDIVSIFVNEEKVLNKISLRKKARIFDFTLPKGEKELYLTVFSDSFGKVEPNTATVKIEDGKSSYIVKLVSTRSKQQSVKMLLE